MSEAAGAIRGIEAVLRSVERSTRLVGVSLEMGEPSPARAESLLRGFLSTDPDVFGSAIAFAPDRRGGPLAPYVHRQSSGSSTLVLLDLASPDYRYWEREWFTVPVKTGEARWSEPYLDEGGGDVYMVTYSVPTASRGPGSSAPTAIVTADLDLAWLNRMAAGIKAGGTGFGMIVSREGRVLGHPDAKWIGRARLPADLPADAQEKEGHGRSAAATRRVRVRADRLWRPPVPHGFCAGERRRLVGRRALSRGRALRGGSCASRGPGGLSSPRALAALAAVIILLSRRLTRPLKALSASAGRIATGDLDLELPPVTSQDEMGALTESFHHMRDSLKTHIKDLKETTAAKERLESELKVARKIQMDMLPRKSAGGEGFELTATLVSARAVGGDLYDHFVQDGTRVFFMVGDVSGKGVPAALFMARTKMLLEATAGGEPNPAAVLKEMNRVLGAENEAGMFVTAVLCTLDTRSGALEFACGGHEPPIIVPLEGDPAALEAEGGPVLGLLDVAEYTVNRRTLAPGDALVLYTDGVQRGTKRRGRVFRSGAPERRNRQGTARRNARADGQHPGRRACVRGRGAAVRRHHHPDA